VHFFHLKSNVLAAVLLCDALFAGTSPAGAEPKPAELPNGHKYLIFAITYRAADATGTASDFAVLGHYEFLEDHSAKLYYFFYDTRKNLKPSNTTERHLRLTNSTALPGPVQIPTYALAEQARGTWTFDKGLLRLHVANVFHDWELNKAADNLFVPRGPYVNADNGTHTVNGWTYGDTRGYAYLSDYLTLPRKITRADLLPDYDGEIQTLVTPRGQAPQWQRKPSGLHVQRYQASADGNVLGYMTQSRWVSTPTLVFSSLLLNYAPHSKLILYSNGGHDFNHNGVFDEYGHAMQMFGIYDGHKISRIVYVEYTYQDAGRPIVSVGHYYPQAPAQAQP
jgi:hypothetical protein